MPADFIAQYDSNEYKVLDHTPGSAVAAGEVVVIGDTPCVAHAAIAISTLGAVAVGGGFYVVDSTGTITAGSPVWWDSGSDVVTATATSNEHFGTAFSDNAYAGGTNEALVYHNPQGVTGVIV